MSRPSSSHLLPFAAACLGIALFSVMDAQMKGITIAIGAYNAMLWRTIAGSLMGGALFFGRRESLPARSAMRLHLMRGGIAAIMATSFFWGIARVPLAEGIALSFIAPLITLYLAAVLLGERIGRNAILASVLGLAGVVVIVAGRFGQSDYDAEAMKGIAAIFVSAVFYAYNLILQRRQAQVATPAEVGFFQNLIVMVLLALLAPWMAVVPPAGQWLPIGVAALLALTSLILLSWAYARAEAQVLVPVEYTAFIWASIFGWLYFRESVTANTLVGAVLIVIGCIIAARSRPEHVEATAL